MDVYVLTVPAVDEPEIPEIDGIFFSEDQVVSNLVSRGFDYDDFCRYYDDDNKLVWADFGNEIVIKRTTADFLKNDIYVVTTEVNVGDDFEDNYQTYVCGVCVGIKNLADTLATQGVSLNSFHWHKSLGWASLDRDANARIEIAAFPPNEIDDLEMS